MLIYLYLFSLIVGGVLLGASILLGGQDDVDGDVDADADADVDVDADADADLEAEADGGLDKDFGHGDPAGFLYAFLSLRFWVFFLAFFGLTGMTLDGLDLVSSPWIGLALAIAMGAGTGFGAVTLIRRLGSDKDSRVTTDQDYIGKTARVIVPIRGAGMGKVRVDIRGSSVDLLASGLEDETYDDVEEVLIVEMDGARARVARMDPAKKADR